MDWSDILFLILAAALWIYLLIAERNAGGRIPLWVRYVATTLALLALVGLWFPVSVTVGPSAGTGAEGVTVFTEGTPDTALDAPAAGGIRVTTDTAIARRYQLPLIQDWPSFSETHSSQPMTIHGYGLTRNQLDRLPSAAVTYRRPPLPQGIISCSWPLQLQATSTLTVSGEYHHTGTQPLKLVLTNASVAVDSAIIDTPGVYRFALSHQPPQVGNSLLELAAIDGTDTIQAEKIPVSIRRPQPLRVLMLMASPSFDHRFLTGWFEELHYQVAARTRISDGRFSVKTNREMGLTTLGSPLGRAVFEQVDLLVADEAEVAALSRSEQALILEATARGMGLMLLKGADGGPAFRGAGFAALDARSTADRAVTVTDGSTDFPALMLPAVVPLRENETHQPLLSIDGHTVAATHLYGQGFITATTVAGTYSWWLKGERDAYSRFWSLLLDHTVAARQPSLQYVQTPRFPVPFSWITLGLETSGGPVVIDGQPYPSLQHSYLTPLRETSLWLAQAGWHTVQTQQAADTASFYVYESDGWQTARNYATMVANSAAMDHHGAGAGTQEADTSDTTERELPKWPFLVVFFVSAALLWYASRNYNQNVM